MLPNEELDLLTNTIMHAVELAREQLWAEGHGELVYGLWRAEAIRKEALATGEHTLWMAELVVRWRYAVDSYCDEYSPRLGLED